MSEYDAFVATKLTRSTPTGIASPPPLSSALAPFQRDLTAWALRRGRAAIFADTGLGKTRMQLEWAQHVAAHTGRPVLILAPLAVAAQTAGEGMRIGVPVAVCREQADARDTVNVTNYERLHRFDPAAFGGVVLDESSCIKHHEAKTLNTLMEAFADTPFRLCATATPSPNDYTELGTHAEFLGICSRAEMLSEFFCHDGGTSTWRLKGHARGAFWRFVASWGALVRRPSDLGHTDDGYVLPPLTVEHHVIPADSGEAQRAGLLFPKDASTLSERRTARRASLESRAQICHEAVRTEWASQVLSTGGLTTPRTESNDAPINELPIGATEPWLIWVDLNAEQDRLERLFGDRAFSIRGADSIEEKEESIRRWLAGERPVMISKCSILGFGLNFQHCARMAFVGVTDSWEAYYQAVRRCWRFGQRRPVEVRIFTSELEGAVVANLKRKEADALVMAEELSAETRAMVRAEVIGQKRVVNEYAPSQRMEVPSWIAA